MRTALLAAFGAAVLAFPGCSSDSATGASPDAATPDASSDQGGEEPDALGDADGGPEPDALGGVHKVTSEAQTSASDPYVMDEPTQFRTVEVLGDLDVRALSTAGGTVWVGTASGLYRFDGDAGVFVEVALPDHGGEPVRALARRLDPAGRALAISGPSLYRVEPGTWQAERVAIGGGFQTVRVHAGVVWLGGNSGVARLEGVVAEPVPGVSGKVTDLAPAKSGLWVLVDGGVAKLDGGALTPLTEAAGLQLSAATAIEARSELDELWVAVPEGLVSVTAGGDAFALTAGIGKLPTDQPIALWLEDEGALVGHAVGATWLQLTGGTPEADHYAGPRWIPADEVRAVARDDAGSLWLGTAAGVTRVAWVERTLAEVAAQQEALLDRWFWRMDGFVASDVQLDDPWAEEPTVTVSDKDNDGLWTQMQIGAWCYAYAATGDEAFYDKARRAMDVMMLQIDVPSADFVAAGLGDGFITRSLVRDDEGALFDDKATRDNWHLSEHEGRQYYWKDDTSSDEYVGHFYGYPLFHDLCAKDEAERAEVASYARRAMDYVIAHGYELIDLDGDKTTHGHWNPERLAAAVDGIDGCVEAALDAEDSSTQLEYCAESWFGGGWLNSVEIMGHLLATWHMTGDEAYFIAYDELVTLHRYDEVATPHAETVTITDPANMNHSDHELAMLAYQTLIRYEPDDARRALWIDGLAFLYAHERPEHNPLWAAYMALAAGSDAAEMGPALESLREMPLDRRQWRVDNNHRQDAESWPLDRFNDPQFDRAFPYDEIRTVWWNGNLYVKSHGGDGSRVSGPLAFLLPYWALRYAGVIGP